MKLRERAAAAIIFLLVALFISLPSTTAVPSSRSLKSLTDANQNLYHEYDTHQLKNGRIDVELADYTGTGANNHHDPKSPPESF